MAEKLIYSKIARYPVPIPTGVDVELSPEKITVKSSGKQLQVDQSYFVKVEKKESELHFKPIDGSKKANAMSGTICALVKNVIKGVTVGFEKKLVLIGVGYRAQAQGAKLNLTLGFSHPLVHDVPQGITIETPSQTEITVKGIDKQLVGQVAAEIRAYRPPEPYKGKGVRYADEHVVIKESSKKT